jgi:hypothetical protein
MRKRFALAAMLLAGMAMVTPNSGADSRAGAAQQNQKRITVPAGTRILIRTIDPIDTTKQKTGYRFTATLETNLQAEDTVIAPRGTTV